MCGLDENLRTVFDVVSNFKRDGEMFILVSLDGESVGEKKGSVAVGSITQVNLIVGFEMIEFCGF